MMPQMDSGDTLRQRQDPREYGAYTGNPGYQQQYSGTGTPGQNFSQQTNMYDDDFMDAFAQRLSQRMAQGPNGKLNISTQKNKTKASAGQRLALAIVSIAILVPLISVIFSANLPVFAAIIALGTVGIIIIVVNAIFNLSW